MREIIRIEEIIQDAINENEILFAQIENDINFLWQLGIVERIDLNKDLIDQGFVLWQEAIEVLAQVSVL